MIVGYEARLPHRSLYAYALWSDCSRGSRSPEPRGGPARAQTASNSRGPPGTFVPDLSTRHDHHRHGRQRVSGRVELADPIVDAGRRITEVRVTQDWDCRTGRYRVVQKIYRTDQGEVVSSDNHSGPWIPVPDGAPDAKTRALVCPRAAPVSGGAAQEPARSGKRRAVGPQVVIMAPPLPDLARTAAEPTDRRLRTWVPASCLGIAVDDRGPYSAAAPLRSPDTLLLLGG